MLILMESDCNSTEAQAGLGGVRGLGLVSGVDVWPRVPQPKWATLELMDWVVWVFSDQILQSFPQAGSFLTPVLQNQELQDAALLLQESSLG